MAVCRVTPVILHGVVSPEREYVRASAIAQHPPVEIELFSRFSTWVGGCGFGAWGLGFSV